MDIDLSGNGLAGRIKAALGINPLDPNNPLTLTPLITGEEPDIVTYKVPISYNLLINAGQLFLNIDGAGAKLQECDPAPDGSCLLKWNTDYETPVTHYLQSVLCVNQYSSAGIKNSGLGAISTFQSVNVAQFYPAYAGFSSSGATLYAATPTCQDASYTINLYDPSTSPPTLIKTIGPNTTSCGVIQELWDLTYNDGTNVFSGNQVQAVFNVTLQDPGAAIQTQMLYWWLPQYPDGYFDLAYADNIGSQFLGNSGSMWWDMQQVVDGLLADWGSLVSYQSDFNSYDFYGFLGYPGWLQDTNDAMALQSKLSQEPENFYFYGHGNPFNIGDGSGATNAATINVLNLANALQNPLSVNGAIVGHPYRFVFLDACYTAEFAMWQHAFGIWADGPPNASLFDSLATPQAFLGWESDVSGVEVESLPNLRPAWDDDTIDAYTQTIQYFYLLWMNDVPLDDCIRMCSGKPTSTLPWPLPVKGNSRAITPSGIEVFRLTSKLKLAGYSGLKRLGYDPTYQTGVVEY